MKKKDVFVGRTYFAKISGKVVPVRLQRESLYGGWDAVNTITNRSVRIKTAAKLRKEATAVEVETFQDKYDYLRG